MSKALYESLKMDLPALAEMLRSKGRGKDTMLAHITPKEAALLKRRGGSGSVNPDTGLPEFEDSGDYSFEAAPPSPVYDTVSTQTPDTSGGYGINVPGAPSSSSQTQFLSGLDTQIPGYTPGAYADYVSKQTAPLSTYGQLQPGISAVPGPVQVPLAQTPQIGFAGATQPAAPADQSLLTKAGDYLTSEKGLGTLARLGLAGGLGVFGAGQARKGGQQVQAATQEQKAIAQPYQQQGQQLIGQAQRGELTPQSQQALDAAKAQLAQSTATRGGVGAQQAANQVANLYQTLLGNQYTYGLQIMQIGDNYATGAIKSGLQLDQQLQQSTTNFYTQLASIAAGGSGVIPYVPQTPR